MLASKKSLSGVHDLEYVYIARILCNGNKVQSFKESVSQLNTFYLDHLNMCSNNSNIDINAQVHLSQNKSYSIKSTSFCVD